MHILSVLTRQIYVDTSISNNRLDLCTTYPVILISFDIPSLVTCEARILPKGHRVRSGANWVRVLPRFAPDWGPIRTQEESELIS